MIRKVDLASRWGGQEINYVRILGGMGGGRAGFSKAASRSYAVAPRRHELSSHCCVICQVLRDKRRPHIKQIKNKKKRLRGGFAPRGLPSRSPPRWSLCWPTGASAVVPCLVPFVPGGVQSLCLVCASAPVWVNRSRDTSEGLGELGVGRLARHCQPDAVGPRQQQQNRDKRPRGGVVNRWCHCTQKC